MRVPRLVGKLFWDHPLFWFVLGIPLWLHLSKLPVNSWNVEILIARNLLDGFGFVVSPLDPPALWRPPLAVAILLPIQLLFRDPRVVYAVFGSLTLTGFLIAVFYLMKNLGGNVAAHYSMLFVLTTPAFTTLVGHQLQLLSYILVFSLVTVSILATLRSWQQAGWRRDVLAGICWGIAFLARPEVLLLFAASQAAGLFFHRSLETIRSKAILRLVLQTAAFLAIYLPCVLTFSELQKRYDLVGQEPLITFYAGANLADNQLTGDPDSDGYRKSVTQFGPPESYHSSFVRFAVANPRAVLARMAANSSNFVRLIRQHQVLNVWDCLVFVLFGSILVFARPPALPVRPLLGLMSFLVFVSPYFLMFHMDVRYSLLLVLTAILWLSVLALVFWTAIGMRLRNIRASQLRFAAPTMILVFLCAFKLGHSIRVAGNQSVDLLPWSQLAERFRSITGSAETPIVGYFQPDGEPLSGGDFLWFSYFARTAVPWCGKPNCDADAAFPRERIYSFRGKHPDYLWIPDEKVKSLAGPSPVTIANQVPISGIGAYSLIEVP